LDRTPDGLSERAVSLSEVTSEPVDDAPTAQRAVWLPYVLPTGLFIVLTAAESQWPAQYPMIYIAKVIAVSCCLVACRKPLSEVKFDRKVLLPAILVGAAVFVEWVWLGPLLNYPRFAFLGHRTAFNPLEVIKDVPMRLAFLSARIYGLALLIPLVEEVFWRSFALRYFTDPDDFRRVRQGAFSWTAFGVIAIAFGAAHTEWLDAIICASAYALLLRQTGSLFACVVAHAVTNLLLAIYIVTNHAWGFW